MKKLIMLLFLSLIATGTFAQQTKKRELLTFEAFEAKLKAAVKMRKSWMRACPRNISRTI